MAPCSMCYSFSVDCVILHFDFFSNFETAPVTLATLACSTGISPLAATLAATLANIRKRHLRDTSHKWRKHSSQLLPLLGWPGAEHVQHTVAATFFTPGPRQENVGVWRPEGVPFFLCFSRIVFMFANVPGYVDTVFSLEP